MQPKRPFLERVLNFSKAAVKHVRNGMKKRTESEIAKITEICKICPDDQFDGTYCRACGCKCRTGRFNLLNKITWESEHCPLGHW